MMGIWEGLISHKKLRIINKTVITKLKKYEEDYDKNNNK